MTGATRVPGAWDGFVGCPRRGGCFGMRLVGCHRAAWEDVRAPFGYRSEGER
jgi:hypothetical protein